MDPGQVKLGVYAQLIQDMFDTLYDAGGVGLSAIQIGSPLRLFVMDVRAQYVFFNPAISLQGAPHETNEGCLSLPGIVERVERAPIAVVDALDKNGEHVVQTFTAMEGQCCQHEVEHLDGITIPDKLGPAARERIASQLKKQRKNG